MNICYIVRSFSTRGGTENYIYNMSTALAKLGHNIHIVSSTGQGQWDLKGYENKIFIHQFDFKEHAFTDSWRLEKILPLYTWRYLYLINRTLPSIIKKYAIDIIEATDWGADAWAYLPHRDVPVCVRLHGHPRFKDDFEEGTLKKWPKNYIIWMISRKHILGADLVTGVSQSYTNLVRKIWDIKDKDIKIIPIGIDLEIFHQDNIAREDQTILFAGRLEKSKGIDILAQAIPLILKKIPKAKFYFAGRDIKCDDSQETWSQRLIKHWGNEKINYLGPLSTLDLIHYYRKAMVCVMPSLYEPGGTVAFEAMCCGCPVIASRVGGLEEAIHDRQTGLLIPAGNAGALANASIELLQNPQMRQQLSKKAFKSTKKYFGLNDIVQQTLDAYSSAIKLFQEKI